MFDFTDKVVAVSGASGIGIGRVIAERFFCAGAKVAICSRSQERIELAATEIAGNQKERIHAFAADTSTIEGAYSLVDRTVQHYGRIDILINNAGVQFPKPSIEVTSDDWQSTVDTNLRGYFFAAQRAAQKMIGALNGGTIINIGSVNALTVVLGQAVYAATKAGISQMTKSLAREWGRNGIRVNCVGPGSIPTLINHEIYKDPAVDRAMCEKIPMGRRGTTQEVADATLYLASEYASYITGQTLFVDGGLTLVHG
jgi:NAD(P)-dependent dehydrogenase (short-subunit alcohol dehydrogenase family)